MGPRLTSLSFYFCGNRQRSTKMMWVVTYVVVCALGDSVGIRVFKGLFKCKRPDPNGHFRRHNPRHNPRDSVTQPTSQSRSPAFPQYDIIHDRGRENAREDDDGEPCTFRPPPAALRWSAGRCAAAQRPLHCHRAGGGAAARAAQREQRRLLLLLLFLFLHAIPQHAGSFVGSRGGRGGGDGAVAEDEAVSKPISLCAEAGRAKRSRRG